MITTETLFTGPFGVASATPAQRAACRILDALPLEDLAEHPDVAELIGGADALASLPAELPREVVFLASVRSGKTLMAAAAAVRMSQTVDLTGLGPGEVARVSIVSLTLDLSAVAFGVLRGAVMADRSLRRLLVSEPTVDSLTLRHPTGRHVEIKCVAAAKAGASLVARWSAGVIFDEAPRFIGREDGAVNLEDLRSAVIGRLRPGAQALYIGSAWAPAGPIYDWTQERFGKPGADLVILRGTGEQLNPNWWTPERCAALEATDPVAYRTDVLGEFADAETGLLNPIVVRQQTRAEPLDLSPDRSKRYAAAVDPSEGSTKGNGFTLVLVEVSGHHQDATFRVALAREWRGTRPNDAWREIAAALKPYGVTWVVSDQYAAAANADLAARYKLQLMKRTTSAQSKTEMFTNLASLIHQGRVELAPEKALVGDLLALRKRVSQTGGYSIILPRTSDGRHCDFAPSLAAALRSTAYRSWQPAPGAPLIVTPSTVAARADDPDVYRRRLEKHEQAMQERRSALFSDTLKTKIRSNRGRW